MTIGRTHAGWCNVCVGHQRSFVCAIENVGSFGRGGGRRGEVKRRGGAGRCELRSLSDSRKAVKLKARPVKVFPIKQPFSLRRESRATCCALFQSRSSYTIGLLLHSYRWLAMCVCGRKILFLIDWLDNGRVAGLDRSSIFPCPPGLILQLNERKVDELLLSISSTWTFVEELPQKMSLIFFCKLK